MDLEKKGRDRHDYSLDLDLDWSEGESFENVKQVCIWLPSDFREQQC